MNNVKKLVIYYSFEGNTKFIAENIAAEIGADLLELKPKQEIKTHGFMKYVWGGRQAMMKARPELEPYEIHPENYDLLVIGTPVWAFTLAPPLNSFLAAVQITGKKIALFCCDEGSKGKTFVEIRKALSGNEVLGEMEFVSPLRHKEATAAKAREWVRRI